MVQGDIVKRSWSKNSQISEHNDILDIWDTGSHIYERWPNGDEFYWKIISRDLSDNGFTEILEQQALWQTPGQVLRREQIPLLRQSASQFQLGGWIVEQEVVPSYKKENSGEVHRKQAHNKTSLQRGAQRLPHKRKPLEQQVKAQSSNS
jgi:hypothetical protein